MEQGSIDRCRYYPADRFRHLFVCIIGSMTNGVKKAIWRNFLFNLLLVTACSIPLFIFRGDWVIDWLIISFIILAFAFLFQLIQAIIYLNEPATKEKGQGMLISLGLLLLIGGIVCTAPMLIYH